ncbi:LuxR C-terminal-related transcriptional regulator [Microbacterium sp. BH-3-3-3]|uniref:helix-turn-helix transcriptional regulator n=1 Tax=Microbacterium sp. BH-3-3-3 TaxID=1906742 RepID=UPI000AB463F0|nr:LuxR C-terminal-related transcriptional regulator [Microbacterium sp. BH-3-3-3]
MRKERSREWAKALVGADRNAGALASRLREGTSLVVAGPRGSGRSYLLRTVAAELERWGPAPVVLRPSTLLSDIPFGAIDATDDPRAAALRDGPPPDSARTIVIVDDVDALDTASTTAIVRAAAARRVTVLIGVRTARARAARPTAESDAQRLALGLWHDGFAKRIDLGELISVDAEELVAFFPGSEALDSATRAGLVWRADGSRTLLRHLLLEALSAVAAGRDPLRALENIAPQSRLAVAVESHVADIAPDDLMCLSVVHRLPHLELSVATRLFPSDTVDGLVAGGLMHADGTPARRLTANDLIAREGERQLGSACVRAVIDAACERMLAEADEWWSLPISLHVAEKWHRDGSSSADAPQVDPLVRARIALDAARIANDRGDSAHAAAHAARGLRAYDHPDLRLEAVLASGGWSDSESGVDASDRDVLRRLARLRARRRASAPDSAAPRAEGDADTRIEVLLVRSGQAGDALDWAAAADLAAQAVAVQAASSEARLRALITAGTSAAFRGGWSAAYRYYRAAERLLDSRQKVTGISAKDRLSAVMFMLAGYQVAGADGNDVRQRLDEELHIAAREGGAAELTLAGAAASIAFAGEGRPVESQREWEAALGRQPLAVTDSNAAMIELGVAEELAMSGRTKEARASLASLDLEASPMLLHGMRYVETTILAAEGRDEEARATARAAAEVTAGTTAAALRIRDLFRLSTLGAATREETDELIQLAATTDLPLAAEAVRRLSARSAEEESTPVDELRLHNLWTADHGERSAEPGGIERLPAHSPALASGEELTRREHEIAVLVVEGLTNREIATRLFLSVRTVESHVYQARLKVGAASRRDLGRMVAAGVVPVPPGVR